MDIINIKQKFSLFQEYWRPKIVGEVNDFYIKLAKLKGSFIWHHHDKEDELFYVIEGTLTIKLRDGELQLRPGELTIIPKGVDHLPVADEEVLVMLLEPKSTVNTGKTQSDRKVDADWI